MWSPWWCRGLAVGQVDGTEQAACEWAARVFHLALKGRKGWDAAAGITEMRYHVSGSLHHLTLRCFTSVLVHSGLCFSIYKQSCPSPAISWFLLGASIQIYREGTLHQPYEGQLLKLDVGGQESIYAWCLLSHLSHSFPSWLFLHSFLLQ